MAREAAPASWQTVRDFGIYLCRSVWWHNKVDQVSTLDLEFNANFWHFLLAAALRVLTFMAPLTHTHSTDGLLTLSIRGLRRVSASMCICVRLGLASFLPKVALMCPCVCEMREIEGVCIRAERGMRGRGNWSGNAWRLKFQSFVCTRGVGISKFSDEKD